ncbi:MAG TPA: zinc-dependent metalloprotease, partial [Chitinophagales bacterium]|nr:zinc-dependent metalloprotease [Chitinophagales bacterium]
TYYAYNNIDYSDMSLQHQMCKPEITEVTSDDTNYPNAVPAGCGRHLIIKGRFFGNEKGNIRFHNTSNSLATDQFLWLDNFDMSTCSWTNNEISVVLPNKSIDSYNSGGTTIYSFYTLHSDVFKVITSYSTFSDDKFLNIPYNLFNKCEQQSPNSVLAAAKYRYKLVANDAVHNTMNFRLHTNLFQSEEVMSVIYRALDKWQCATGIQYRITENFDDDIDASFVANEENNNISSIFYYEDLEFTGLANSYGDVCGNAVEIDEIDILLDINGDTPGGWEQTLLHELGHAHGLAHTLPDVADNIEDLMQPGPDLTQLITEIEGDDLQGALNVVNYSTENTVCGTMLSKMGQGTLQMKDSWCDLGIEPNFSCAHGTGDETWDDIWESPDLWNCQGTNDCTEPQAIKAGQTNRLRFNIRNPNNCTSDVPTIHLYWTVASTGEVWPEDWIHNNDNCMQGNEIGTLTLPALAPNETRIGSVNWVAPSLSTFSGCDANDINDLVGSKMEMCLLARLETPSDPIIREEQDVPVTINILNNNNIVTRNTVLEDIQYNQTGQASIIHIKNNNHFDTNLNLVIKGLVKLTLEEAQQLHIDIILTQSLWDRWTSTGAQGIGVQIIEPKVVRVTNLNTAKLLNIPMLADESRPFGVRIKRINNGKVESSPTDYKFGIIHEAFDPHIIINKSSGCVFNVHTKTNDIPISSNNLVLLAYPNPSDASLNLSFNLPNTEAVVSLYVYDMQGRLVNKVFEGNNVQNGVYSFDVKTEQLPRGIYMATLKTTQDRKSTKISIIK